MPFSISPVVQVREIDLTTIVPAVSTTEGAIAMEAQWGPIGERVLCSDENDIVRRFWKPNNNNANRWFCASNFLKYGNKLYISRAAGTDANNATSGGTGVQIKNDDQYEESYADGSLSVGDWVAKYAGTLGNSLKVSTCPSANAYESTLTGSLTVSANSTAVTGTSTLFTTELVVGDRLILNSEDVKVASITNTTVLTLSTAHSTGAAANTSVTRRWEYYDSFDIAPGTSDYADAVNGVTDEQHVIVVDEDGVISGVAGTTLEKYEKVSTAGDAKNDDGTTNYYKSVINQQSQWIRWADHNANSGNAGSDAAGVTFDKANLPETYSLSGGTRGTAPTNADFITAYSYFKDSADVNVSMILGGDANQTIALDLINNIAEVRKDCMVLLSPLRANVVQNTDSEADDCITFRNTLPSTSYAAMDCNWKYQYDKYNDVYRYIPCNGDVGGTFVRTDLERDPWWSPGGYQRGNIKNVIKLAWNPKKAERDKLYRAGINPIVSFPGKGPVLFGDKTMLSRPSAFDRINVRRLFIVLEKAIATAAESYLFEFNDEFTRAQFVNLVEPFLRDIQGRRGITDFRVVCNETNNTGEVIDRNEFIGDIYIKPARSINFIQLNFVAVRTNVEFDEIVGKFG